MGLHLAVQSYAQSCDPINAHHSVCCIECNHYIQIHFAEKVQKRLYILKSIAKKF